MSKIFLLALANIRKAKGQTAILALLFLICSMVLNAGLAVLFGFGNFFDQTAEELNTSEAYFSIPQTLYTEEVEQYLLEETSVFQKNSGIIATMTYLWKGESLARLITISDKDEPRALSQWKQIGDALPETPDTIYVPYLYQVAGGYNLGDGLTLEIDGETYHFTVAGYIESIYHDNMYLGNTLFVPGLRYQELSDALAGYRGVLIFANGVENYARTKSTLLDITGTVTRGEWGNDKTVLDAINCSTIKTNRTSMSAMMSAMMLAFTGVIVAVCLLVIRFRIRNTIEEDMPKIGSLQAIGYTSRQITLSVAVQYALIALTACLAGIAPAYLLLPTARDVFAQQSGLFWEPGFEPLLNLSAVATLTLIVTTLTWIAALKIRKIQPVQALRGGHMTHSFKRNPIPLEKSRLPLTVAMSLKTVLQGMRQSVSLFIILASVSFTAVIAVVLYYNAAVDLSTFEKVPGFEKANTSIAFMPGQDSEALRDEVTAHKDVRKAQYQDMDRAAVDSVDAGTIVMADFSARETDNVYVGIFPRHDNEIAISGILADMLGKGVGDEVKVGKEERPYLITGLTQGMESGNPVSVYLSLDGMRKLDPDFQQVSLLIYLNKGVDTAAFVEKMEDQYSGRAFQVIDMDASFAASVSSIASIMSLVGLGILIIAGLVIILILYFVISSTIIRRRRELGIQKAIGYLTVSLMNQISLGFAFPILFGAAAGCLLGMATTNALMSIVMASVGVGVMKANFIIDTTWVSAAGICIVVLSYLASILITWRVRKISAYGLVKG